jgi:DNA-binding transcriptional MerR regulator
VSTLLSIGELSSRTGVATSALRYYEEIGLVRPVKRVSQQRRYNEPAVDIGVVLLLRDVGFTLAEVKTMTSSKRVWTGLAKRKLGELQQ